MGVIITAESRYGKELEKWNLSKRRGGHNADGFEMYPLMVYRATRADNGNVRMESRVVKDEGQEKAAKAEGFAEDPKAAVEALDVREKGISQEAAERIFRDRNLSEAAKAEVAKAEAATPEQVPDIPEQPRQKRAYHRRQKPSES